MILALQVVLEHDTVDVRALVTEAFGFLHVGAIEFRVVLQFARLRDAGIEGLAIARVIVQTPRFSADRVPLWSAMTTLWSQSRRTV